MSALSNYADLGNSIDSSDEIQATKTSCNKETGEKGYALMEMDTSTCGSHYTSDRIDKLCSTKI